MQKLYCFSRESFICYMQRMGWINDVPDGVAVISIDSVNETNNHYFKDLTQTEIAQLMGMNQVQVSRREKKILVKLKDKLVS